MDTVRRMKLQTLREKIVQDVDVEYIFDYLISKEVIFEDEMEQIKGEKTRKDRARHLLDILTKKNVKAFEHFVESLEGPYPWLREQLLAEGPQSYQIEETSFFDALLLGGLPQSPQHNVERKEKINEVRQQLNDLKRGKYAVLHGMTGSGKSCLAAAALDNKQLVIEKFRGVIYWIGIGDVHSKSSDDLLYHMTDLLEKLGHHPTVKAEMQDQSYTSIKGPKIVCVGILRMNRYAMGLLILDDVSSPEVIDAFDIGCKILVTTKDIKVMNVVEGRHNLIKISEGFLEEESLALMAKCSGLELYKLPSQAKKIHQLSKGVPMIIALIGAQLAENKEDVQRNSGRWDHYVKTLMKRDFKNIKRVSFSQENGVFDAIGLCVDSLPDAMKNYYQDFALFVEDVNIKPEVLETLWSRNKYEIEDIMSEFVKKSLAVSKWNELLNSYVYGIHDLLLSYLKHQLSDDEKKALHTKLLNCYESVCGGNFSNLPNDNYIYSYLGHHLSEAELWSMFPKLYLDLEFIGAKLKITGPGDLLVDYRKYNKYIIGEDEHQAAVLSNFEQFIQSYGLDLYKYQDVDIVQCGLQEPRNSYIYKEALKIAKTKPNRLYLEFLLEHAALSQPQTLCVTEEVFAACFTSKENKILTANGNGVINLWDMDYSLILHTFPGHKQRILHLALSPDGKLFLSCSEDSTVKIWKLEEAICKNTTQEEFDVHGYSLKTPSPRIRQDNWSNMFSSDNGDDGSYKTFSGHTSDVLYASFSPEGHEVISCCRDGSIKVWNFESGNIRLTYTVPTPGCFANSCIFSVDNSMILFGGDDNVVYVYDNTSGNHIENIKTSGCIIAILSISDNEIAAVTHNSITVWMWENDHIDSPILNAGVLIKENLSLLGKGVVRTFSKKPPSMLHNIQHHTFGESPCASYICATLSQDGNYIIVGASNFTIVVWDIDGQKPVMEYQDHNGWVRCLDVFSGGSYQLLLSGSDDRTIKVWHVELVETEKGIKLQQNFDALWDGNSADPNIPLLAAPDDDNKFQLLRGRSIVTETVPEPASINCCRLSNCGQFLVYGCSSGEVKVFEIKSKITKVIMRLNKAVHYLHLFCSCDLIVIAADQDSSLKIWRGNPIEKGTVMTCAGQTDIVVQCFPMCMGQKLLSCAQDGSVKMWETTNGELVDVLVGRHTDAHLSEADLSLNEDLLVLCDVSGSFLLAQISVMLQPPYVRVQNCDSFCLDNSLRSCKLSHDAQLLALGQDNGDIIVWDVTSLYSL